MKIFVLAFLLVQLNYSSENEDPCTICRDILQKENEKIQTTKCKHKFHSECLNKWIFEQKTECPTCGKDLSCVRTAAMQGDNDKINRLLTKEGADVNEADEISYGYTPIYFAIWGNHFSTVKILLEHGANVNVADHIYGMTPLHLAAKSAEGRESIVKILLANNPENVDAQDNYGETALLIAATIGNSKVVEILLEKGANMSQKNSQGKTAFDLTKDEKCMLLLGNMHRTDKNGMNSLHLAALKGYESIVKILVKRSPGYISSQDKYGNTPILIAAKLGHNNVVEILAEQGANVNATDHQYGFAAIHWAALEKCEPIAKFPAKKANVNDQSLFRKESASAPIGNAKMVKFLLEKGANINAQTLSRKESPLMIFAANGNSKMVEMLLQKGASRHLRNYRGRSALDLTNDNDCILLLKKR